MKGLERLLSVLASRHTRRIAESYRANPLSRQTPEIFQVGSARRDQHESIAQQIRSRILQEQAFRLQLVHRPDPGGNKCVSRGALLNLARQRERSSEIVPEFDG